MEKEGNIGEKYLLGNEILTMSKFSQLICEISGSKIPGRCIPTWAVRAMAIVLTFIADITKKPPFMWHDWVNTAVKGGHFHGGKAEKELGIVYTPVGQAIEEHLDWQLALNKTKEE